MSNAIQIISIADLAFLLIPVVIVLLIQFKWSLNVKEAVYGLVRMLAQLLLVGYVLTFIFQADNALIVLGVITIMILASSWIALNNVKAKRKQLYQFALVAILIGGGATLAMVIMGVLKLDPWYLPQYSIPLAGMAFANAMNAVSLAAERYYSEINRETPVNQARQTALRASLIPVINGLFAVGLVSLPGMMTGQILSGVSPLIAVRYQIMVMCLIFGAAGISAAIFLTLVSRQKA